MEGIMMSFFHQRPNLEATKMPNGHLNPQFEVSNCNLGARRLVGV
jgi:hypothetical protein